MKRVISVLLTLAMLATMFSTVFALPGDLTSVDPKLEQGSGAVSKILGAIQWIGFIVGIAMCIWIGIKYLTSGAGKKAEVKSTMIPWLVGAACIALAPTLASAVFKMFAPEKNGG